MIKPISQCRICANTELTPVIDLGIQALTGIFPKDAHAALTKGPLELVQCTGQDVCGLLQLKHSYDASLLYGDHYGYRSSLNASMVRHLGSIAADIIKKIPLGPDDAVLDIGSNDGTLLKAYPSSLGRLIGMDPAGLKFKKYYPSNIELIDGFFSADTFRKKAGHTRPKVITSIAMFYDLASPLDFMRDVHSILSDDGIWAFEQSYMPAMLKTTAYDTICHEHFEYYGLRQIKWMTDRSNFKIIDVDFNDTNGGSFRVTVAKAGNPLFPEKRDLIDRILREERNSINSFAFEQFKGRVMAHRQELLDFLSKIKAQGKTILGYGASTKGNVILQFCGLTPKDIPCIAEVNDDKFGCFTPGTGIPIVAESMAREMAPDYFLVLPWHFKDSIILRERSFTDAGGSLLFPLPHIHEHPLTPMRQKVEAS